LIVDDEPAITDTLCMILEQRGFDCMKAYNAEVALEIGLKTPPDLLLTDVMLPLMNGVQLAIQLRNHIPAIRVLLLSGQAGTSKLLKDARAQGFEFDILAKPIHPVDLIEHVNLRLNR